MGAIWTTACRPRRRVERAPDGVWAIPSRSVTNQGTALRFKRCAIRPVEAVVASSPYAWLEIADVLERRWRSVPMMA
jgi:hypothetical protein